MANLTISDALNALRDSIYEGRDTAYLDYLVALEIFNTFKELNWTYRRTLAELDMCKKDRLRDYEDRQKSVAEYHETLRQYACDCPEACTGETRSAEYCGWNARQMIGG